MKNVTNETIAKLAKHVKAVFPYQYNISEFSEARLENAESDLLHHLGQGFSVEMEIGGKTKEIAVTSFDNDIAFCEVVPHEGYDVVGILWEQDTRTQGETFTLACLMIERLLRGY